MHSRLDLFRKTSYHLPYFAKRHHPAHGGADWLYVVEQHEQQREGAYDAHQTKHFLDSHHQNLAIFGMNTAIKGIGHLTVQAVAVETGADALSHPVADEARHGECHEERWELDKVFQVNGHG